MTAQGSPVQCAKPEAGFIFSSQPRKIEAVEAIPFLWPTKASIANEYIDSWRDAAANALAQLKLSTRTLSCIFSHTSRRDGTCRLTDKALSARSGRSVASTKRDVQRLKRLGFIEAAYEGGNSHQERVRVLRIVVPLQPRSSQRIPPPEMHEVVSTYPPYVDPLDKGECRNV